MICLLNRNPGDKATNNYTRVHPCYYGQCATCGWNANEHKLRLARGLTTDENGLRHFTKTKAVDSTDDPRN